VVLHDRVEAVLGALYPVDDLLCSLFVLLLHRAWASTGDLRSALTDAKHCMRSGQWADDPAQEDEILAIWCSALAGGARRFKSGGSFRVDTALQRARDHFEHRRSAYLDDHRTRLVTEAFVLLG